MWFNLNVEVVKHTTMHMKAWEELRSDLNGISRWQFMKNNLIVQSVSVGVRLTINGYLRTNASSLSVMRVVHNLHPAKCQVLAV